MNREPDQLLESNPSTPALFSPESELTLELALAPDDLLALARLPGLRRAAPSRPVALVWYDNPAAALAEQGLILLRDGRTWRMQALEPSHGSQWPACQPAPILAEADTPGALSPTPPFDAVPVAAFEGRRRRYQAGAVLVEILHGSLRGIIDSRPACRLLLSGPASALEATLQTLAPVRVAVPRASLPREALAVAKGADLPPRHLGAPSLPAEATVSDGLADIIAHLLDVMLYWVDQFRRDGRPEAVHQGRVATRRLRSALTLYKRAAGCPELDDVRDALKSCASRLGAARDWDVFLEGTGARLSESAGGDERIDTLLRAAKRRRDTVYAELAAYLAGDEFRRLEIRLAAAAVLRPWERLHVPASLSRPTCFFAGEVLDRRLKHVRRRGRALDKLPAPELHELRKDCKKLRYAAEFFAPAFSAKDIKPLLKRLSTLQEELGTVNDTAVAAELMDQLGRLGRGYAGGVVEGWASAAALPARQHATKTWKKFRATAPFWKN